MGKAIFKSVLSQVSTYCDFINMGMNFELLFNFQLLVSQFSVWILIDGP